MDVWLVSLEGDPEIAPDGDTATALKSAEQFLSPDEKLRAGRFRFESDRAHWIRARSALRSVLARYTGIPAAEIRFTLGPHGKPGLADGNGVEFNLSHAGSWAMVAVTLGVPAGIDIEHIRDNVDMAGLLRRMGETDLPDSLAGLYSVWNRREAMTKAVGGALLAPLHGDFHVCDLESPPGYSAALALLGHRPRVRQYGTSVLTPGPASTIL